MNVGVIGAGSWGTALAKVAVDAGHRVSIWAYETEVAKQLREGRNDVFLPGVDLPTMHASTDLADVVPNKDILISVVPSHVVRAIWSSAAPVLTGSPIIVSATKGIENGTLQTMHEVLCDVLPDRLRERIVVCSGPSFAAEVGRGKPAAVVAAAEKFDAALAVQSALATKAFRVYTSVDPVGVEMGGATKNVVAIAAGIADGLELGKSAIAGMMTRGLAEITRLAVAKGATPMTLAGLSGMGDLILTCTTDLSRNRTVGLRLGRGETLEAIRADMVMVAEGVLTAKSCFNLAKKLKIDMPICGSVYSVLYEGLSPEEGVSLLLERQLRHELEH